MLKEQDELIEVIRELIIHPPETFTLSVQEVFEMVEHMIAEHVANPTSTTNRLTKYLPTPPKFFLPLRLVDALNEYHARSHLLSRRFVPPTFKEVRHILNLAVINANASKLRLVTFDADDTIYEDGGSITKDSPMATIIVDLLKRGIVVSLVTAAGYPNQPERYEQRLRGILQAIEPLPASVIGRFLVMGGECNYLHTTRIDPSTGAVGLQVVPGDEWKDGRGVRWSDAEITDMLDKAEKTLQDTVELLQLNARVLRKERACGIINTGQKRFTYETLEEIALTVQHALKDCTAPHCAFNGGNDVWVDVGNKALGISALQLFVPRMQVAEEGVEQFPGRLTGAECLHVGDRFTRTGNDTRSRQVAMTAWVSDPAETVFLMNRLLKNLDALGRPLLDPPTLK